MFPTRLKSSNQQPVPFTPDNRAKKNPINFQDPFVQEFFEKKKKFLSQKLNFNINYSLVKFNRNTTARYTWYCMQQQNYEPLIVKSWIKLSWQVSFVCHHGLTMWYGYDWNILTVISEIFIHFIQLCCVTNVFIAAKFAVIIFQPVITTRIYHFVIFKPLSYCFKETIGFDVKD